jgi:membrane associated rhomboid family serine protease
VAFRPNWYEDGSRRGAFGNLSHWTGFRWIVTLNISVFLLQLVLPELGPWGRGFTEWLALRAWWPPEELVLRPDGTLVPGDFNWLFPVQLVTYAFLHDTASLWHILLNLMYLWFFGPELEAELGKRGFLRMYLGGAIVGGLVQWAYWVASGDPTPVVGASGAVYTVMTLFALKWPHRQILIYLVIPVPVWLLLVFRVVGDGMAFLRHTEGGTAVLVHLGGAAFGLLWWRGAGVITAALESRKRQKALREFQEASTDRREMDRILAKIQATGLGSLDTRERGFLERRSRELREQGR